MVFLTSLLFGVKSKAVKPDRFWKRRQVLRLTQHYTGRKRNCYSIAIKTLHRALNFARLSRKLKKEQMTELWETRLDAACNELGTNKFVLLEGLARSNIVLDRKVLTDLAIREPRTFKSLSDIAATKFYINPLKSARLQLDPPPPGVITRGML